MSIESLARAICNELGIVFGSLSDSAKQKYLALACQRFVQEAK
jgi:hypothetical protein